MNFMEEFAKYMVYQAHANPWCKQEHEFTVLRRKYLMAIGIGMYIGGTDEREREFEAEWRNYEGVKLAFIGSEDVIVYSGCPPMDEAEITYVPEKIEPRVGLTGTTRELIRDTLHAFREWDTDSLYWLLRDVLPGKVFANTAGDYRVTPLETLGDAFSHLSYEYCVDATGYEHAELWNLRTPGPVIEINMPKQCDGPCDRKTFWVRDTEKNKNKKEV